MKFKSIALLTLISILSSCTKKTDLEFALEMAASNRTELEKVLSHYSKNPADSLKLRAAEFLISNMVFHYTKENKSLKNYYNDIIKLNNDTLNALNSRSKIDSLGKKYKIDNKNLKIKFDIASVKASYLIKNIDHAIKNWYSNPWTQHLSFADFCEYVLPYRFENENLENWREKLATKYMNKIKWMSIVEDAKNSTFWAASYINDSLKKRGYHFYDYKKAASIQLPPLVLEDLKLGTCEDYAQSTLYIMRACGIPICIDFVPQWPKRSKGHVWNVLFDESGKEIPYMGGETALGTLNRPGDVMGKVYRRTFSYQYQSLFHIKEDKEIPALFNTPYIKDVSANYFSTIDVEVKLFDKYDHKFAYLAVFDNQGWIPIQWGEIKRGNKVVFRAMGKNCMYLPVIFKNGKCEPAGYPFTITNKAKIVSINTEQHNKQQMILHRKYPINRSIFIPSTRNLNGVIEASNKEDFKDSLVACTLKPNHKFDWDSLISKTTKKYRYWRLGATKKLCNIAELQFIYDYKNIIDTTKIIHKFQVSSANKPTYLFDNNKLTYIEIKENSFGWIGIDFGKPVAVNYFRFLPRNDDNTIVAGDSYELMMWSEAGWKSLIKCIAKSNRLMLKNVPTGGLYLLRNHTKGKEERIFTYENGQQVWW